MKKTGAQNKRGGQSISIWIFASYLCRGCSRSGLIDQSQNKSKIRKNRERGEEQWWHFGFPKDDKKSLFLPDDIVEAMKWMNPQQLAEFLLKKKTTCDIVLVTVYLPSSSWSKRLYIYVSCHYRQVLTLKLRRSLNVTKINEYWGCSLFFDATRSAGVMQTEESKK